MADKLKINYRVNAIFSLIFFAKNILVLTSGTIFYESSLEQPPLLPVPYIELIQFSWKKMCWKVGQKSHLLNQGEFLRTIYKQSISWHCVESVRIRIILVCIILHLVRLRENMDQNNSEYGHLLRSVVHGRIICMIQNPEPIQMRLQSPVKQL